MAKVRQAMLTHWEVEQLLRALDCDPQHGDRVSLDGTQTGEKLYNKLLNLKSHFLGKERQ